MTRFVGTPLRGIEFSSVSDEAISARVNGDGHPRIRIDAGGRITWSGGSVAGDTTLYRDAADLLTTDDVFKATGGLVTLATDGAPNQELPNGAVAIDTTNHVFYFRSNNTWNQVTGGGGASIEIGDTPPAGPETGDLWFESDTGSIFVYYDSAWVEIGSNVGEQGLPGETGATGATGIAIQSTPPTETDILWADTSETGTAGIPDGGAVGQVLAKTSASDYVVGWTTPVTSGDLALKADLESPTFTGTVSGITKTMVGLGSVDNTADSAKPVSTAQQTALNLKANLAGPTFTGTVTASTVNSTNYQQGGNAGSIVRSAAVGVPFTTSNQLHLVNMPSGCNIFNLINVHPTTGVNNTVTVTSIRYGDWSGVQTTNQIAITGFLGNGVHLDTFSVTFYWLA